MLMLPTFRRNVDAAAAQHFGHKVAKTSAALLKSIIPLFLFCVLIIASERREVVIEALGGFVIMELSTGKHIKDDGIQKKEMAN